MTATIPNATRYAMEVTIPAVATSHGEPDAFNLDLTKEQAQLLHDHGIKWVMIESILYFPKRIKY